MQIVFTEHKVINGRCVCFLRRLLLAVFFDSLYEERNILGGLNCNLAKVIQKKAHFKLSACFALVSTPEIQY